MRLKFLGGAALVAALGVAMLPASALPVAQISENVAETADFDSRSGAVAEIHENEGLADYDSRTGKIAPTSAQQAHAGAWWGRRRCVGPIRDAGLGLEVREVPGTRRSR